MAKEGRSTNDGRYLQQRKMYETILKYKEQYPDAIALGRVKKSIREYIEILRENYKKGSLVLDEEEIEKLLEDGILLPTGEWKEASEKYNISRQVFKYISSKYGNIDRFIRGYKNGDIVLSSDEMALCGISNPQGIVLSPYDISVRQKRAYIDLLNDICNPVQVRLFFGDGCKRGYINVNDMDKILQTLPEKQKKIIVEKYGLDGNGTRSIYHISLESGNSLTSVNQTLQEALERLKAGATNVVKTQDTAYYAEQKFKNWQTNIGIESLNFSESTFNALHNIGVQNISDLNKLPQRVLKQFLDKVEIEEVEEKYSSMQIEKIEEESKAQLRYEVMMLRQENSACAQAYYNFMNYESIFDSNQVIKATIPKIPIVIEQEEDRQENLEASRLRKLSEMKLSLEEKYSRAKKANVDQDLLLEELQGDLLRAGIIVDPSRIEEEL